MLYRDYLKDKYQNTAVKLANAEGVPCVLEYTKGKNIRNYEVYGNSVQDGTPTPESPVEIQSVGDLTKNLINESDIKLSSGYWSDIDGHMIGNNSRFIGISPIKCNPNEKYTLSSNLEIYTIWFFNNNTPISKVYRVNKVVVFMTPENCNNLRISLVNTSGNTDTIAFKWVQLELGTTATEYEPYGYKIPIVNSGKNLLPYPYHHTTKTENGITFTDNGDGSVTVSGTATEYVDFGFVQALPCRPNQAYTVVKNGVDVNNVSFVFCDVNENGKITRETVSTTREKTFTVTTLASTAYIALLMKRQQNNAECTGTVKPTLELGTTATEYEPYRVPVTANIYLDEPLRKIGDYADYIDFKNQKVVRNVKEITLNGSERWTEYITYNGFWYRANDMKPQNKGYGYSNYYSYVTTPLNFGIRFGADNNLLYFTQMYTPETPLTLDDWKAKLAEWNTGGNPLIVYYILATPTEESISLPTLKTVKGTSIMTVDTSIQPSNIKTKYIRT